MAYYWWIIAIILCISILTLYAVILDFTFDEPTPQIEASKTIFFAVTSIITLSIIPLIKINLYGVAG